MSASPKRSSTRVLVISQVPPPFHGSTVITQILLSQLAKAGWSTRLVDRRFSKSVDQIGRFSVAKVAGGISLIVRLALALVSFRPTICVFFVTNRVPSFLVDWALSEVLRLSKIRVVNYVHTIGFEGLSRRNKVLAWMVKRLLSAADETVCLGKSLKSDVSGWVRADRISTIYNTPGPDVPPVVNDDESAVNVVYLSNLIPEKGASAFVKMAEELSTRLPYVKFRMAGAEGTVDYMTEFRRVLDTTPSGASYLGAISGQGKWDFLAGASVLVFPSTYPFEAQPLTILEALSVGTRVVAYDTGGIRDILSGQESERLVPSGNLDLLSKAVESEVAAARRGDLTRMAISDQAKLRFSVETFTSEWVHVLRMVLGRAR
jgi:glycosyltransferase involved in cell wall biosynthesis